MPNDYIPFHRPSIGPEEHEEVRKVLDSGWLTTGPVAQQFEKEFAAYVGCKYALAVNSATAALHLALDAIGTKPGDEILLPTYTFTASAEVAVYMGARPVLCDSVADGFNIDPEDVVRRLTSATKAIMPVHIAGEACQLDRLRAIAAEHSLHVIEDAAHSLPTSFNGERVGANSELAAFSFYATKTITTGEGGMLTTNNEAFARRAAVMRLHGISGDAWKRYSSEGSWYYEVVDAGFKVNMPDLLAAVGVAQLKKADQFHQQRRHIAEQYQRLFEDMEELQLPPAGDGHAWHLFVIRLRPELLTMGRNEMIAELKRAGIGTSVHFIPLHLHPYYKQHYGYKKGDFPNAENAYERSISLPIFPGMTEAEVLRVATTVKSIIAASHRRAIGRVA